MIASRNTLDPATIASELHLPVSSVYRILGVLRRRNLVTRGDDESGYRLGLTWLQWAGSVDRTVSVLRLARPVITRLARETGETALLALLEENRAVTADVTVTSAPVRVATERGRALPLHAGASSKAILAHLPEERWKDIVTGTALVALTSKTLTDAKQLREDRRATRARGYAISEGEVYQGACGVAAPIFDEGGAVTGSLAVAGPFHRLRGKRLRDTALLVLDGANTLNIMLGAHGQRRFNRGGMEMGTSFG